MKIPKTFWEDIINKELEKYKVTYQELVDKYQVIDEHKIKRVEIDGIDWFHYYTFDSEQEFNSWKEWVKEYIKTNIKPKPSKALIDQYFNQVNFFIGLKINY